MEANQYKNRSLYVIAIAMLVILSGCTKDALNVKPQANLEIPSTLADFQALLDAFPAGSGRSCGISYGKFLSDNAYAISLDFTYNTGPWFKPIYTWQKSMFNSFNPDFPLDDWNNPYKIIEIANVALDGLKKVPQNTGNQTVWNNVEGQALMIRAAQFSYLATIFAQPYDASGDSPYGIPLRTSSDINAKITRSSVHDTYTQIINDLTQAAALLPNISGANTPLSKFRPSKAAAYALLARTYLSMGDYSHTYAYADSSLNLYSALINYNTLDTTNITPFPYYENAADQPQNTEVTWWQEDSEYIIWQPQLICDSNLYNAYGQNDLRRSLFFTLNGFQPGLPCFNYGYDGAGNYDGVATNEVYLMRAEAAARLNKGDWGMKDLNTLLTTRWKTHTYLPYTATTADEALQIILTERRKELVGTGLRWIDLRRLNKDPRFAVTITHILDGQTYTLPPNDNRYTLPIPTYILAGTNMQQNP